MTFAMVKVLPEPVTPRRAWSFSPAWMPGDELRDGCQRPALILAHNKTLAAQFCHEFKAFFPSNAVEYFVSYYDYYQPEAYIPLFIEKESTINEELDKLRLAATRSLFERRSTPAKFVALMAEHVPDRYRHSMRYFGLLSPRAKCENSEAVFQSLGQHKRARPQRISWRNSLIRNFQTDPLRDSKGEPMHWTRSLTPS